MRCGRVRKILPLLLDKPEGMRLEVSAHLASCFTCRQEFAFLQRVCSALRTEEAPPAPANFAAGVMARIAAADRYENSSRWGWLSGWKRLAVAAAALLIIAASALAVVRAGGPGTPEIASKPPEITRAPEISQPVPEAPNPENTPETPGTATGKNSGTKAPPESAAPATPGAKESKPQPAPEHRTIIATTRPVRVFLSQQRVLRSTLLRVEVQELAPAGEGALAAARAWGASGSRVANTTDGQRRIQVFQFQVDPEKAEGFVADLGTLGTVVERQDDRRDITNEFNQTKAEYESLAGSRNAATESERTAMDAELAELERQLGEWDAAAGKWIITLCLVQ